MDVRVEMDEWAAVKPCKYSNDTATKKNNDVYLTVYYDLSKRL